MKEKQKWEGKVEKGTEGRHESKRRNTRGGEGAKRRWKERTVIRKSAGIERFYNNAMLIYDFRLWLSRKFLPPSPSSLSLLYIAPFYFFLSFSAFRPFLTLIHYINITNAECLHNNLTACAKMITQAIQHLCMII